MRKKTLLTLVFLSLAIATALAANKFTLVIDAGHGGHDSGAPGAISKEKDINLKVALAFGKMVERNCQDVKVIYTRTTDIFIPLSERANIANRNKADLFISVHTNALDGGKISRGFETYTLGMHRANDNLNVAKRENSVILIEKDYKQRYAGFDPKSSESYIMFELMQDKNMAKSVDLAKLIQSEVCAVSGRVNKGVHQAGFLVLRETSMPSCLIELGFITTPDEEQFLNSADGQNLMAKGIYNAFLKYKKQHGSTKIAADGASDASDNTTVLAQQTIPVAPAPAPRPSTSATKPSSTPKPSTSTSAPSSATPKAPSTPKPSSTTESSSSTAHPVATRPFVEDDTTSVTQFAEQRSVRKLPTTSTASSPSATPAPPPPTAIAAAPSPATPAPPPPTTTAAAPRPDTQAPPPPSTTAAAPRPATPAPPPPATTATALRPATPVPPPPATTATAPRPVTPAPPPPTTTATAPRPATPAPQPTPLPSSDTARVTATIPPPPTQPTPVTSQQPVAQDSPSVPSPTPVAPPLEAGGRPIFKVQIAANSLQLPVDDAVFKGLQGVDMYVENDLYKYTVGATPDFEEISQLRKTVSELFPQAFIIAFRDGMKIPLAQAIKEYRNAKQTK